MVRELDGESENYWRRREARVQRRALWGVIWLFLVGIGLIAVRLGAG